MILDVAKAFYTFFSGFGLNAYTENNIYDMQPDGTKTEPELPYLSYDLVVGDTMQSTAVYGRLWYPAAAVSKMAAKADEIHEKIKNGYTMPVGNGYVVFEKGEPFAQLIPTDDGKTQSMYLNITATFLLN